MEALSISLINEIKELIMKNNNEPNIYVIDAIQMLILRETNEFLTYMECEEIYNSII